MINVWFSAKLAGRSMMLFSHRKVGNQYEALAKKYLQRQGLTFLEQNFSTKFGEIDLIMQQGTSTVFIEVKYRKHQNYGNAAEFVCRKKAQRLIKTAYVWLKSKGYSPHSTEFRFDVIAIHHQGNDINWIKNAITEG